MKKLIVEVADTPIKRQYGLMDRKSLGENEGMLFKFPRKEKLAFWMQNTYIPLDIAFMDDDGKVLQIKEMFPLSTRSVQSSYDCKYALEVNHGWFKENNISEGSYIIGNMVGNKRTVLAQGFVDKLKNFLKNPLQYFKPKPQPGQPQQPDPNQPQTQAPDTPMFAPKQEEPVDENLPPEQTVEGDNYPDSAYVEKTDATQQPEDVRDVRGKIEIANNYNLQMEVMYWTLRGHILPPRKIMPIPGEGYVIKNGKNGYQLVAFDISPNISGAGGWTIKGNQPKSFILDNIIKLSLLDANGQELTPEALAKLMQGNNQKA